MYENHDIYRIMAVFKLQVDIITSIAEGPIGRAVILVLMHVETFKTDNTVFISNIIMCLTSH